MMKISHQGKSNMLSSCTYKLKMRIILTSMNQSACPPKGSSISKKTANQIQPYKGLLMNRRNILGKEGSTTMRTLRFTSINDF